MMTPQPAPSSAPTGPSGQRHLWPARGPLPGLLALAGLAVLAGCSSSAGTGGGGAIQSSPGPGVACNPQTHISGCRIGGNQVMTCDANVWVEGELCAGGATCAEQYKQDEAKIYATCFLGAGGGSPQDTGATVADGGGAADGAATDTGAADGAASDTGGPDSGAPDTVSPDTGSPDTGTPDTGVPDGGTSDTGTSDTGTSDTTSADAGGTVTDPLIEPLVEQPPAGSTVLAPTVTCPSDGTKKTNEANSSKVVYHVKSTVNGDTLHGSYERADSQGNILAKGCFINGKPAGAYTAWYTNGTKQVAASYNVNGQAMGPYEAWDDQGKTVVKGVFKDDEAYGTYQTWYDGGTQLERKLYFNPPGQLRGIQQLWHENGQEEARFYYDIAGKQTGTSRTWNDQAKLVFQGNYVDGLANGNHVYWYDSGALAAVLKYTKGSADLLIKHENGNMWQSGKLVAGKREGLWQFWATNGTKVFEGAYKTNVGPVTYWWDNGTKGLASNHDVDLRYHGQYDEWDSAGTKTWSGVMDHGARVGTWQYQPQAGQIVPLCYVGGRLVLIDTCPSGLVTK